MADRRAGRLSRLWLGLRVSAWRTLRENFWGLADRGLMSASNFVTVVVLARALGEVAFGAFMLVYSTISLSSRVQNSLINQPQTVLGATREGDAYVAYTTSTLVGQVGLALASGAFVLIGAAVSGLIGTSYTVLILTLAPVIVFWQFQGYLTTVMYTEERLRSALFNDAISFGVQAVIFVGLWQSGRLTGPLAFVIIAVTSLAATLFGCWQIRHSLGRRVDWGVLRDNWHFGKWLGGANLASWLWTEAYLYLAAAMLGPAAAGVLKAADALFGPLRILLNYFRTILPIRFARALKQDGEGALWARVKSGHAMLGPILGGYSLLLAIFATPLSRLIYGNTFANMGQVLALYSLYFFFGAIAVVIVSALNAQLQTRSIFNAQAVAAIIAVPLGWVFIELLGLDGAVVSMILAVVLALALNWNAYARRLRGQGQGAKPAAAVSPADLSLDSLEVEARSS